MKAFKYILFLLLIAIIGTAIYIAVQPNAFSVTRTRTINAPAPVIYNNVIDFKNWGAWSSWAEADPDMKTTLPQLTKGKGASVSWVDKDGKGTMKTIETTPNKTIEQNMQFEDMPPSTVTWDFKPNDNGSTNVTWTISGKDLPFGFKAFATLSGGMEKQIGPHYERSLEKLDSIVNADMKKYTINVDGISQHGGGYYIYNTTACKISELTSKMQEMMPKVSLYAKNKHLVMAGTPFTYYHKWDEANNAVMFSCCIPTTEKVIATDSNILTGQLPPFKAVKTTLKGDYKNLKEAWDVAYKHIKDSGFVTPPEGPVIETYITDPTKTPNPAHWITEIYMAIE